MHAPLITATALHTLLQRSSQSVVLADCRFDLMHPQSGAQAYAANHLPNAFYLNLDTDLSDKSIPLAGRHPLPDAARFTALMRSLGIGPDTHLVAYDAGDMAMASRLWWLARYYGHPKVSVLDGGIAQWLKAGFTLSTQVPAATGQGLFTAREQTHMRAMHSEVHSPSTPLVDSRDAARYKGDIEPIDPVAGHIPGAINAFWKENLAADGTVKPIEQLQLHWRWLDQYPEPPIVYCGSGVTACVNLLGLEISGRTGARLFAGSWSEWCQRGGAVETGLPRSG